MILYKSGISANTRCKNRGRLHDFRTVHGIFMCILRMYALVALGQCGQFAAGNFWPPKCSKFSFSPVGPILHFRNRHFLEPRKSKPANLPEYVGNLGGPFYT